AIRPVRDLWRRYGALSSPMKSRADWAGPEEAEKTSIHLVRHTAFAGIATRRSSLILTLKSESDIRSPRVEKREQTSANRWHVEVRLTDPAQVDRQLTAWLRAAYELAGP